MAWRPASIAGPIFPTSTKENPDPVTGLSALRGVVAIKGSLPLVAIGGITPANAVEVFKFGAYALAMIAELIADTTKIAENMSKKLIALSILPDDSRLS